MDQEVLFLLIIILKLKKIQKICLTSLQIFKSAILSQKKGSLYSKLYTPRIRPYISKPRRKQLDRSHIEERITKRNIYEDSGL